jgi:hypothetical protein
MVFDVDTAGKAMAVKLPAWDVTFDEDVERKIADEFLRVAGISGVGGAL